MGEQGRGGRTFLEFQREVSAKARAGEAVCGVKTSIGPPTIPSRSPETEEKSGHKILANTVFVHTCDVHVCRCRHAAHVFE